MAYFQGGKETANPDIRHWYVDYTENGYEYCCKEFYGFEPYYFFLGEYWEGCKELSVEELDRECDYRYHCSLIAGEESISLTEKKTRKARDFYINSRSAL